MDQKLVEQVFPFQVFQVLPLNPTESNWNPTVPSSSPNLSPNMWIWRNFCLPAHTVTHIALCQVSPSVSQFSQFCVFQNSQNMIFFLGLLLNNFRWLPYVHQTTHWWNGTWYRYKLKDKTSCVWSWRFAILAGINWIWHKRTIFKFYGRIADNSILGFCLWIRGTRIGVTSHGIFLKKNISNILRSLYCAMISK